MPGFYRYDRLWVLDAPLDHSADEEIQQQITYAQGKARKRTITLDDIYRVAEGIERRCGGTEHLDGLRVIIYPGKFIENYQKNVSPYCSGRVTQMTTAFVLKWDGDDCILHALDRTENRRYMAELDNPPHHATEAWLTSCLPELYIPPAWQQLDWAGWI